MKIRIDPTGDIGETFRRKASAVSEALVNGNGVPVLEALDHHEECHRSSNLGDPANFFLRFGLRGDDATAVACNESRSPLEGKVSPRPFHQDQDSVLEANEEEDVNEEPS